MFEENNNHENQQLTSTTVIKQELRNLDMEHKVRHEMTTSNQQITNDTICRF